LAGLIAGVLVSTFAYTGLISRSFDAAQDQLYPGPTADPRITLIAIDQHSKDDLGAYPWLNSYHAKVINYLASLHPRVIMFDVVLDHLTLKGKSAETFRVFRVSAIREEATSPWVAFPTEAAMAAYSAQKRLYGWQSVFTAGPAEP